MKRTLVLSAIALFGALQTFAAEPPRLIVQIVVGSMRAEDLNRYAANFGEGGFRRLTDGGTVYTDCRYDFQQTTTPVALATLSTGAMPSTHGVIGARWIDYTSNRSIGLIDGDRGPGAYQLIAPTLGETLRQHHSESRTATVAAEAMSAVVMAGHGGETYWLGAARRAWGTPRAATGPPRHTTPRQSPNGSTTATTNATTSPTSRPSGGRSRRGGGPSSWRATATSTAAATTSSSPRNGVVNGRRSPGRSGCWNPAATTNGCSTRRRATQPYWGWPSNSSPRANWAPTARPTC
ncbi:alkaline phosphatase family protein [Alistipes sp. CAG:268]|uniref:alkaline phosphatase family protein n=1 Tax=Alistipes sp. CAG:268 TaxID=1262693 RepID=UPI0025BD3CE4|nr:alkaline phosphatase family protein [Alistipes sp. CAG:268]